MLCSSTERRELRLPLAAGYICSYMAQHIWLVFCTYRENGNSCPNYCPEWCLDFFPIKMISTWSWPNMYSWLQLLHPKWRTLQLLKLMKSLFTHFFSLSRSSYPTALHSGWSSLSTLVWYIKSEQEIEILLYLLYLYCYIFFFYSSLFWMEVHVKGKNFYANTDYIITFSRICFLNIHKTRIHCTSPE